MREPARSALKVIDLDNKENVLGHYRTKEMNRAVTRPLPVITVEHCQKIKRLYDAFPNHMWCISSATLGLHVLEKLPGPQPLHIIEQRTRPILKQIGLGKTEVHPMSGRALRRPFGQDYFTFTDDGLLSDWRKQLNYFDHDSRTPRFDNIFVALRDLMVTEWKRHFVRREPGQIRYKVVNPEYAKFFRQGAVGVGLIDHLVKELNQWATDGYPVGDPCSISVPEIISATKTTVKSSPLSADWKEVFNGKWVQSCRAWAIHGLPGEDSIFPVVSQLARWFYFIEFWKEDDQNDRIKKICDLLTEFCLTKHNNYITRLNLGQKDEVINHVGRIVTTAIEQVDSTGKKVFGDVRSKRDLGAYKKVYFLEPLIRSTASSTASSFSSVGFIECCTLLDDVPVGKHARKSQAIAWTFEPDDTPLPARLEAAIASFYDKRKLKMNKPTLKKLTRLINFIRSKGGEARLSIKALRKIGFSNHRSRQHISNLEQMGVIDTQGYCPAAGISKLFRLREPAKRMYECVQ